MTYLVFGVVFVSLCVLRGGPLEKTGGGGDFSQKKNSCKGKLF